MKGKGGSLGEPGDHPPPYGDVAVLDRIPGVDTDLVSPELRFDFWRETVARLFAPMEVLTERPNDFQGYIDIGNYGVAHVASVRYSGCTCLRTPKLIRQGDPEVLQLALSLNSYTAIHQNRRDITIGPSDFAFVTTSRPYVVRSWADRGLVRRIMVMISRSHIPLAPGKLDRLTAEVFSGRFGIGGLLSAFLTRLAQEPGRYRPADAVRLGTVLTDLLSALLADRSGERKAIASESQQRVLLLRIYAFIEEHLDDPNLNSSSVAAAHHISLRLLQRLFQDQELGVAGWIRNRRLERCRRDLIDSRFDGRSIQSIARRYGFVSAAHFSGLFRATYGMTPQEYRNKNRR